MLCRAGYDGFIVYNQFGVQTAEKLRTIWMPFWIFGIVSVGLLGLSVLLALALFLATMSGFAGKYMVCLAIPMGYVPFSFDLRREGGSFHICAGRVCGVPGYHVRVCRKYMVCLAIPMGYVMSCLLPWRSMHGV